MSLNRTAFYASLHEMKSSYSSDLVMISNYEKVFQPEILNGSDHIELLKNQLRLMIETIEQMVKVPSK